MTEALLVLGLSFACGLAYGSFFEWVLHRFLMHRPLLGFNYAYQAHAITHHGVFGSGHDYHIQDRAQWRLVTMAWWNAPVLLAINSPAGLLAAHLAGSWWAMAGFMTALLTYYGLYEYLHWCMHVPESRWFQGTRLFRWIDRHHRLHHLQPMRNLNVVFPIADFTLRTRISRAPMPS